MISASEAPTIEAEATTIDTELATTSALDQLVANITTEAARLATEYMPREIEGEDDYKQSKRERSAARKDIAELRSAYDQQMRAIKDAVRDADARVKAALDPLARIDSGYKAEVDAYEARWKSQRIAYLSEAYSDFAPDLVPLVPFERLMARFGTEKGKQWDARSLSDGQAEEAMRQAVERIAADEKTIESSPYEAQDKAALKADYFQTLDLSGALRRTQEAKEQRERVARLEQERREREAEARRRAEAAAAAQAAIQVQPDPAPAPAPKPEPAKPIIDTRTQLTAEEYQAELAAVGGATQPITSHQRLVREVAGAQTILVALYSVTGEQMRRLAGTLSSQGIHGKPKGTGRILSEDQCYDLLTFAYTRAQSYDAPKARKEL